MNHPVRITLFLALLLAGGLGGAQAHAAAGDLDRSFAGNGKAVRDLGRHDNAVDVAVQRNRKVVVLVQRSGRGRREAIVTRFRKDGRIDRRFGKRGTAVIRVPGNERAAAVAIQPNGRIVAAFTSVSDDRSTAIGIARLRRNGKPDPTLDRDGIQTVGFDPGQDSAGAADLAVAPDGDIVVAGGVDSSSGGRRDFALARFDPSGRLDTSFSGDGLVSTDFEGLSDTAEAVQLDSQGRIVVVGGVFPVGCCSRIAIARYEASGELDSSFAADGLLIGDVGEGAADVAIVANDRIAVASSIADDFLLARYTEGGDLDTAFSGDGVLAIDFADGVDEAEALTTMGSRLVVTGYAETRRRMRDFATARVRPIGELDRKFSGDGRRAVNLAGHDDTAYGVAVDRKKAVVLAGLARRGKRGNHLDTGVVRLRG